MRGPAPVCSTNCWPASALRLLLNHRKQSGVAAGLAAKQHVREGRPSRVLLEAVCPARLGPSCPSLPAGPLQRKQVMSLRLWRLSQAWRMLKKLMIWGCAAAAWLVKRPSIFCVRRSCSKRRAHRANRATRRVHEANLGQARAHGQIGLSARSTGENCLRCGPLGEILGLR